MWYRCCMVRLGDTLVYWDRRVPEKGWRLMSTDKAVAILARFNGGADDLIEHQLSKGYVLKTQWLAFKRAQ